MSCRVEPLVVSVARAVEGDNLVRGRSVRHELAGRVSLTGLCALALGGRLLDEADCALLDDFFVSASAADPRIWPLKVSRVVAAYGDPIAGYAGLYLAFTSRVIGPLLVGRCGELLRAIAEQVGDDAHEPGAIEAEVKRRLAQGARLPGFGAPFRPADERVTAFGDCLVRRGRKDGRWFRLTEQVARAALSVAGLSANIALWCAAMCLELGFEPAEMGPLAAVMTMSAACGVASEGSKQNEAQLRQLPPGAVRYLGPGPRATPRAEAAALATGRLASSGGS